MKLTIAVCALLVFTECPWGQPMKKKTGNDSPIIISDGSTRLKHRGGHQAMDDGSGNFVMTVQEKGRVWRLACSKGFASGACDGISGKRWRVTTFDKADHPVLEIDVNGDTVTAKFHGKVTKSADSDGDEANGGEIFEHPSAFYSFTPDAANPRAKQTCSVAGSGKKDMCVLQVRYQ